MFYEIPAAWPPSEGLPSSSEEDKVLVTAVGLAGRTCDLILIRAPNEDP